MDARAQRTIAAVEAMYRDQDFSRIASVVTPDLVVDWSNSVGPYNGVYRGLDEARGFLESFSEAFAEVEWRASDPIQVGDRLALQGNVTTLGRGSGVTSTGRGGQAWVFDDHPFYVLLDLAVGGTYGGEPDSSTPFPRSLLVDYVPLR